MEVCGVGSTTRGYWRQGASDLEEVKPDNIDYLTGSTLSWKKAENYKPTWWPPVFSSVLELGLRDDQLFLQLEDTRGLPYALFVSHSWLGAG